MMRLSFNEEEVERAMNLYRVLQGLSKVSLNIVYVTAKSTALIPLNLLY